MTFAEIEGFGRSVEMVENFGVTPLLRGRDFRPGDRGTPVVIVNAKFAEMYLRGRDPLSARIRFGIGDLSKNSRATIVGVGTFGICRSLRRASRGYATA